MRVVINQWSALGQRTGIGHYTSQLVRCLRTQACPDAVDAFPNTWLWHAYRPYVAGRGYLRRFRRATRRMRGRSALALVGLLPRLAARRIAGLTAAAKRRYHDSVFSSGYYQLYHEPNYIPIATDLLTIVTVHDLSVTLFPQWHPVARIRDFERRFYSRLGGCRHVLTDTESVRREIIRTLGMPPHRVTSVHLGARSHMVPMPPESTRRQLARLGVRSGYVLHVGTIEPRKNLLMLMKSYCALPAGLREKCPLLLVGGWGWESTAVADYFHKEARHRGVRHIDYVDDRWLPALYNGARAMAFPSFYEGFGLPPIEMLACGGAVLASTAEALKETVAGQAALIDAHDGDAWRDALARVIRDDDWREELRAGAVETAQKFTWERCAAQTLAVYRSVAGGSAWRAPRTPGDLDRQAAADRPADMAA